MTEAPSLRNQDITLRPTVETDVAGIAEAARDPAIRSLPWFGEGFQDSWAEPWVRRAIDEWGARRNRVFSIIDNEGRYLGSVNASPVKEGEIEIAYWVLPGARGNGVATRAVNALLPWLRENFPEARPWAKTLPDNRASQGVLLNCGFVETERGDVVRFELRG